MNAKSTGTQAAIQSEWIDRYINEVGRRLSGGQRAKVRVKLNALGRRILKARHRLRVDFVATQKLGAGKTKVLLKKTLTVRTR